MPHAYDLVITTANNLEGLLASEAESLGLAAIQPTRGAIEARGDRETIYRVLLGSRLASRVLLPITQVPADTNERFYQALRSVAWEDWLTFPLSLAVQCHGRSSAIRHTRFGAQRVKDAIADRARDGGRSVSVDRNAPDARLSVRLRDERAEVALDLAGESLHRRGYRRASVDAPLKEPLAAAVLMRVGWPERAATSEVLFDPCCGAGTLLAEGAMMAANMAPGLLRETFGLDGWYEHDETSWQTCRRELHRRIERDASRLPRLVGCDRDPAAIEAAQANLERLDLACPRELTVADLASDDPPWPTGPGVMVTNPPYGQRVRTDAPLDGLYARLGERARTELAGWRIAVLTDHSRYLAALGLKSRRVYNLLNGQLACRLGLYDIHADAASEAPTIGHDDQEPSLRNRLQKKARHLARWRRREAIACFRLYERDIPEFSFTIDVYETPDGPRAHIREHGAAPGQRPRKADGRRRAAVASTAVALGITPADVHTDFAWSRRPQPPQAAANHGNDMIREGAAWLRLDLSTSPANAPAVEERPLRARIEREVPGRTFLNLFAGRGDATVRAAASGAQSTTSVDDDAATGQWLRDNLEFNGLASSNQHEVVTDNAFDWLASVTAESRHWQIILLATPATSRNPNSAAAFDPERDHADLIGQARALLAPGGRLYFMTRVGDLELDSNVLMSLQGQEITRELSTPEGNRGAPAFRCWRFEATAPGD